MTIINGIAVNATTEPNVEYALTSVAEINSVFSSEGVDNHIDDSTDELTLKGQIIGQASARVMLYLRSQYAIEDCMTNVWVREQATYIACYLISIRRGNPSLYTDMYAQALIDLEQVRDGMLDAGLPAKSRAVVQTPMMDSRFFNPKRVNPMASTRVLPGQNIPRFPYGDTGAQT
jgi:hypothetical protein